VDTAPASSSPLTVQITRPVDNAVYSFGSDITITALVSTGGVAVAEVAFYVVGQQLLAVDSTFPYSTVWKSVPIGSYTLRAVASGTDETVASAQVNITVVATPPVIQFNDLGNNSIVRANTDHAIGFRVFPGSYPISVIELYADTQWIGQDIDPPYSITWSAVPLGQHILRAVATTSVGLAYTSAPVSITAVSNIPPAVWITDPLDGAALLEGDIPIRAYGYDQDGAVERVEFFVDDEKLDVLLGGFGSVIWTNVAAGQYSLTARAIDNEGGTSTSAPVRIRVRTIEEADLVRGPYLQIGTPYGVVVKWRTLTPSDSRVRYGTSVNNLHMMAGTDEMITNHELQIEDLSPDTKYYYSIGSSSVVKASGPDCFFVTAPAQPKPTRIWVIGDSGTASDAARSVWQSYQTYTGSRYTDLWLMLGDNAYGSGTDEDYQHAVFEMYPGLLRQTVLWPTLGNHDTPPPYLAIFTLPKGGEAGGVASGTENYYSFDYGNIHFVCLDASWSDRSSSGVMCNWLREDLAQNTKDWIIAFWHQPPYSKGSHNSDGEIDLIQMRENAVPILESFGVDLVLCGHSHCYERSFLLRGHYGFSSTLTSSMILDNGSGRPDDTGAYTKFTTGPAAHQGTVYVVAGSSGWATYGALNHPAMYISWLRMGSLVLDIDGQTLQAKFLRENGDIDDYFSMIKVNSMLRVTALRQAADSVTLTWQSLPGKQYQVAHTPELTSPVWNPVSGSIPSLGNKTTWTHGVAPGSGAGFYRVIELEE
jgi:hypothetical protein